jgi:hypothetical protein
VSIPHYTISAYVIYSTEPLSILPYYFVYLPTICVFAPTTTKESKSETKIRIYLFLSFKECVFLFTFVCRFCLDRNDHGDASEEEIWAEEDDDVYGDEEMLDLSRETDERSSSRSAIGKQILHTYAVSSLTEFEHAFSL